MFNIYPYLNVNDLNLDWIIAHFKEFIDEIASLDRWRTEHEQEYAELKSFMDSINAGVLPSAMYDSMREWFKNNAFDLVGEMVKQVYFGITDDGYFIAYIPESWDDIIFTTSGLDDFPANIDYGHLILSFNIGG